MSNLEERSKVEASLLPRWDHWYDCPRVIALKFKPMSNLLKEPPYKKRKEEASPLWPLSDDVALSCLARVLRSDHAALSLLSKSYRSLVASPELYKIRSMMGRTETDVYVCLRNPRTRWYVLRSSNLIPIPSIPSQPREGSSVVALDSGIYVIGGLIKGIPTSDVLLLDCRGHTWRHAPSMGVARACAVAAVIDGKIYVVGGSENSLSSGEVFDPKTGTWESLPPIPFTKSRREYLLEGVVRDEKVYAVDGMNRSIYYSPSEGKWGKGNGGEQTFGRRDWCIIDNLLCSLSTNGTIFWCEPEELDWRDPEGMHLWKEVKGLESLQGNLSRSRLVHFDQLILDIHNQARLQHQVTQELALIFPGARLINSGGNNILLFWDDMVGHIQQIWCAQISLEKRQGGEVWGNIDWSHPVMTVDVDLDTFVGRHKFLYCVSVTL